MDKIEWRREVSPKHRKAYEAAKRDFHSLAECYHTAIKEIPAMVQALRDCREAFLRIFREDLNTTDEEDDLMKDLDEILERIKGTNHD